MPRARRRGRPPLDPSDRSVSLNLRLPSRQFDALCVRALHAQCSVPEVIRRVLARTMPPHDDHGKT